MSHSESKFSATIATALSEQMGCHVSTVPANKTETQSNDPAVGVVQTRPTGKPDHVAQQVLLPDGRFAVWETTKDLADRIANHASAIVDLHVQRRQHSNDHLTGVVRVLVSAIEARDPYTCGHSERVACFAKCLATKIGYDAESCERIYLAGLLHDVGKIAVPDHVLQKNDRLNDAERVIIETHAEAGWRILYQVNALQSVLAGVLHHHERWNGQGYPDRLIGESIPIDGRILAVCDAFDAMTSDRTYRKGMSTHRAMEILRQGAGDYWDPDLVRVFEDHLTEIDAIRTSHRPRKRAERYTRFDSEGSVVPRASQRPADRSATIGKQTLRSSTLAGLGDLASEVQQPG